MKRLLSAVMVIMLANTAPAVAAPAKGGWTCKVTAMGVEMSRPMIMSNAPPATEEMVRDKAAVVTGGPLLIVKATFQGNKVVETISIRQADFTYLIGGKKTDPGGYFAKTYDGDTVSTNDASVLLAAGKEKEGILLTSSQSFSDQPFSAIMAALKNGTPTTIPFELRGKAEWFKKIFMEVPVAGFADLYKNASARALKEKAATYVPC